jgi:2-polyprenyl-3-methyl-5-hydroxy-6-metoxy-1,4-benzoquinol methylase
LFAHDGGDHGESVRTALKYTPLERIETERPVDRIGHIVDACVGKRVLDLGAMDETAYKSKRGQGVWLHEEIAKKAERVLGVDNSAAVPPGGLQTADNAQITQGDIFALEEFLVRNAFRPEIVVAGELIEHLENPLAFLRALRNCNTLAGARLLISTPNATALHNCLIGLGGRESTHHDHLLILSYKTLTTLLTRAGFEDWQILPYHSNFVEMKLRNAGLRRALVGSGEKVIRIAERAFPLLSFGFLIDATI